ncbi:MAG: DUF2789 domain-containing protein [Gammaproteobacteria bacterium]|nr:DUF2789 domain-containing protein [Gammaproteobacteria bacterium]
MDRSTHDLPALFKQLGLAAGTRDIERFIAHHSPLDRTRSLAEAPFWTPAQAQFLREGLAEDSDWAEVIDTLDAQLRH